MVLFVGCSGQRQAEEGQPADRPSTPARVVDHQRNIPPTVEPAIDVFRDVASGAGIDFVHFNGMSGEFYICEVKCAGGGLLDYDNDGDLDVYLIQGSMLGPGKTLADAKFPPQGPAPPSDRIYRNDLTTNVDGQPQLHFTDVTTDTGIKATEFGIGMATGDIDNDGWLDIYVTNFGPNQMFHNNGDGTFSDVTEQSGTDDSRYCASAAFLDFDRDGWLDLFVCAYVDFRYATHKKCFSGSGRQDYCSPLTFSPLPDRLYRNRGDGTFEDVSTRSQIVREYGNGLGVVCADFDHDGWPDLYVANDAMPNQLWMNCRNGTFRNDALLGGCAVNRDGVAEASMGIDAGDYDADGDDDLFMTHLRNETNTLFVNDGTGLFEDRTAEVGLALPSLPYTAFGTAWFDYDNDGWLDLFVANGEVQTNEALARTGDPYPLHQRNQLFRNLGNGKFREVTEEAGTVFLLSEVSRGAAFGDVDNDGDIDILVTNNNGPARLMINQIGNRNHWIGLRLIGGDPPRDMLGARVAVHRPDGPTLWRTARSAASYCSANDPRVLVGLAKAGQVSRICVYWPDGLAEQWNSVPIDNYTTLRMGTGSPMKTLE